MQIQMTKVQVCTWWACKWRFSQYILKRLENDIKKFKYKNLELEESPCMRKCKYGPNAKLNNGDIINKSEPAKISQTVRNEITKKK